MKILIVAATPFEVQPLRDMLEQSAVLDQQAFYQLGLLRIRFLITGVGMLATSYHLTGALHESDYELVINAGVAGSFKTDFPIGTVVNVVSERIGDLGAEEADGQFIDLLEMGLQKHEAPPFESGVLHNAVRQNFLPLAQGLSVNKVHGAADSIARIRQKYDVDVESMEGAAVFYVCLQREQAFLEIRAISNLVEPRNREAWNLPLAIKNLNDTLLGLLETLSEL